MSAAAARILDTARRGELHHAVILHGPARGVLRDLAVRLAKTLNCLRGSTGDDCPACVKIDRRIHPDVHFVSVDPEKKQISIEQIRALVGGAAMRPFEGRAKVFVVDPADAVSIAGSNSLLKTLEEPARDTTFILLTRSPDLLLPTIRSRCQSVYVGETQRGLGGPLQADRVRQLALLERDDDLAVQVLDHLDRYARRGESAALLALAALIAGREDPGDSLALLAAVLCDVVGLDPNDSLDPAKIAELRERLPRERLLAAADAALAAIRAVGVNADPRLLADQVVAALAE